MNVTKRGSITADDTHHERRQYKRNKTVRIDVVKDVNAVDAIEV